MFGTTTSYFSVLVPISSRQLQYSVLRRCETCFSNDGGARLFVLQAKAKPGQRLLMANEVTCQCSIPPFLPNKVKVVYLLGAHFPRLRVHSMVLRNPYRLEYRAVPLQRPRGRDAARKQVPMQSHLLEMKPTIDIPNLENMEYGVIYLHGVSVNERAGSASREGTPFAERKQWKLPQVKRVEGKGNKL